MEQFQASRTPAIPARDAGEDARRQAAIARDAAPASLPGKLPSRLSLGSDWDSSSAFRASSWPNLGRPLLPLLSAQHELQAARSGTRARVAPGSPTAPPPASPLLSGISPGAPGGLA